MCRWMNNCDNKISCIYYFLGEKKKKEQKKKKIFARLTNKEKTEHKNFKNENWFPSHAI